jgi:hypothetical protein
MAPKHENVIQAEAAGGTSAMVCVLVVVVDGSMDGPGRSMVDALMLMLRIKK